MHMAGKTKKGALRGRVKLFDLRQIKVKESNLDPKGSKGYSFFRYSGVSRCCTSKASP